MPLLTDADRNAECSAGNARYNGGDIQILNSGGTVLCTIPLAATAFEAAGTSAAGVARMIGGDGTNPVSGSNRRSANASVSGTAARYRYRTSGGVVGRSGLCGTSGTGMVLASLTLAAGNPVEITSATYTVPAGVEN